MKRAIGVVFVLTLVLGAVAVAEEGTAAQPAKAVVESTAAAVESTAEDTTAAQPEEGATVRVPGIKAPVEPLPADSPLKTLRDKAGYAIGTSIGSNLKAQSIDVNPDFVAQGMKDALTGAKPLMNPRQMEAAIEEYKTEYTARQEEVRKQLAEKNAKAGDAFLAENGKKPGVVTLPDGVQYQAVTEGTGAKPKITEMVKVNYRGTLPDGKEFDSSEKNGGPQTFPLNGVIPGWSEALQQMKTGGKYNVWIPGRLAYGASGCPGIEPNALLTFEIELLSIEKSPKGQPGGMGAFDTNPPAGNPAR